MPDFTVYRRVYKVVRDRDNFSTSGSVRWIILDDYVERVRFTESCHEPNARSGKQRSEGIGKEDTG